MGGGKKHKKRSQNWARDLSSLHVFWIGLPSSQGCIFLCLPNKLSCNTGPSCRFKFLLQWDRTEEITHCPDISDADLDLTWLKQPQCGPHEAEAKHSRSLTWQKLPWWKLNVKKTQYSENDKKPSMLETGTAKINPAESSCSSVSDSRRPPVKVGSPRP